MDNDSKISTAADTGNGPPPKDTDESDDNNMDQDSDSFEQDSVTVGWPNGKPMAFNPNIGTFEPVENDGKATDASAEVEQVHATANATTEFAEVNINMAPPTSKSQLKDDQCNVTDDMITQKGDEDGSQPSEQMVTDGVTVAQEEVVISSSHSSLPESPVSTAPKVPPVQSTPIAAKGGENSSYHQPIHGSVENVLAMADAILEAPPARKRVVHDNIQKIVSESRQQQDTLLDEAELFRNRDPLELRRRDILEAIKAGNNIDPIQANPSVMLNEELFTSGLAVVLKVGMNVLFCFLGRWYPSKISKIVMIDDDGNGIECESDIEPGYYRYFGSFRNESTDKTAYGYARDKVVPVVPNAPPIDSNEMKSRPPKERHERYGTTRAASMCEKYDTVTIGENQYVVSSNDKFSRKLQVKDYQTKIRFRVSYFAVDDVQKGSLSIVKKRKPAPRTRQGLVDALLSFTIDEPNGEVPAGNDHPRFEGDEPVMLEGGDSRDRDGMGEEDTATATIVHNERQQRKRKANDPSEERTLKALHGKLDGINNTLGTLVTSFNLLKDKPMTQLIIKSPSGDSPIQIVHPQSPLTGTEVYGRVTPSKTGLTPYVSFLRVSQSPDDLQAFSTAHSSTASVSRRLSLPKKAFDVPVLSGVAHDPLDETTVMDETAQSLDGYLGMNTSVCSSIASSVCPPSARKEKKSDAEVAKALNRSANRYDGSMDEDGLQIIEEHLANQGTLTEEDGLLNRRAKLCVDVSFYEKALEENPEEDEISAKDSQQRISRLKHELNYVDQQLHRIREKRGKNEAPKRKEKTKDDGNTVVEDDFRTPPSPSAQRKNAMASSHQGRMQKLYNMAGETTSASSITAAGTSVSSSSTKAFARKESKTSSIPPSALAQSSAAASEKHDNLHFNKCFLNTTHMVVDLRSVLTENQSTLSVSALKAVIGKEKGVLVYSTRQDVHYVRAADRTVVAVPSSRSDISLYDGDAYAMAKNQALKSRKRKTESRFMVFANEYISNVYHEPFFKTEIIAASSAADKPPPKGQISRHTVHQLYHQPFSRLLFLANEFLCCDSDSANDLIAWYNLFRAEFRKRNMQKVFDRIGYPANTSAETIGDTTIAD